MGNKWRFENGQWQGPDWPLSILYWTPAVLVSGIAILLAVILGVLMVTLYTGW